MVVLIDMNLDSGWIMLLLSKSLNLRLCVIVVICVCLFTTQVAAQSTGLEDCILIIGDSIPAGHAVSEVPGYGFPVIVSEPFSRVLDRLYNELNITHVGIYNLAVGASSLSTAGDVLYRSTMQYAIATSKKCQFAVIFPWINDLPETADINAANRHVQALAQLSLDIHTFSPQTEVVILDYYRVVVTELGSRVYGNSISSAVIGTVNQQMNLACQPNGVIGGQLHTSCLNIEPFLRPLDAVLMTSITPQQFQTEGYRAYENLGQAWLNEYWLRNPNSPINVDGVHLNNIGKERLALGLQNYLQTINPAAFQTIAPF